MKTYAAKIKIIKDTEKIFATKGFTLPYIDPVIKIAWLDVWDSFYLFYYAQKIPDGGTYLEIGSWLGGSLLCAFLGTKLSGNSVSFIGIDLRLGKTVFENTKEIPDIRFIRSRSDDAYKRILDYSVDLCFVDGAHHYAQVKRDILNFWPKIKVSGVLLGHDYSKHKVHRGVVKAVNEIFGKRMKRLPHSRIFMVQKSLDLLELKGR